MFELLSTKFEEIIHRNSVLTEQKTPHLHHEDRQINVLGEIIAVYYHSDTKHKYILCWQTAEL
jgi:hypothetical protein